MTLTNTDILVMELNLMDMDFFQHPNGGTGRNVIILGVDMNSSTKVDNKKKDILIQAVEEH